LLSKLGDNNNKRGDWKETASQKMGDPREFPTGIIMQPLNLMAAQYAMENKS
jgi:hypothetical protein